LPEIHNPDHKSRNPNGDGDVRSRLAILALAFLVFFGFQYVWQPKPTVPIPSSQVQSQTVHAEIAKASSPVAGNRSVAAPGNFGWLTFIAKPL
jgi:hypothetical protein